MSPETVASSPLAKGKRLALVIGVNDAPNSGLYSLKHAASDAQSIAEVLQQCCHFELLETPIIDEQATSDRLKKAIRKLARDRTDDDFLLLYFSGHGQPMTVEADQPDVYFVTYDFDPLDVEEDEDSHCSMRWLWEKLYVPTQAGKVVVILDCCFAGNIGTIGPDPYLEELQARIKKYFGPPSSASGARSGGLRLALTATGHNVPSTEQGGYGVMTEKLLPALLGKVDEVLDYDGNVSLQRLFEYLQKTMPLDQQPSLAGDFAGRSCFLASYPALANTLSKQRSRGVFKERPTTYIPFPRNRIFQPRPGEFERLEELLFGLTTQEKPTRLGLIGVVGLGGVGKTQLAVEMAYRCLDQQRFPAGIFWMLATGTSIYDWKRRFAELALNTDYLPPDDDPSNFENDMRRAHHFCRFLANHNDALLILDNVEDPNLVTEILPALAGGEVLCAQLYTSRNPFAPPGVVTYPVEQLPEEGALHLLLETTRPVLLSPALTNILEEEAQAAFEICRIVGYLPLALVHLRGLLMRDMYMTLVRLKEKLIQYGALEVAKTGDAAPLFATFWLSWEKVHNENAQRLFKLACYFPEASIIPLWLLGLTTGLGEGKDILDPLGQSCVQLQEWSLLERLSGEQVRLHPLVREFGRRLVVDDDDKGTTLLIEAEERLTSEFEDLNSLEQRASREGFWRCLEQMRVVRLYAEQLRTGHVKRLFLIEKWLARESYLLGDEQLWPKTIPGLFYQQLYNRSVEDGQPLLAENAPTLWLRQIGEVGADDRSMLRVLAGHLGGIMSVAFCFDGTKVLTGSADKTAWLWDADSGKEIAKLEGHTALVWSVAFCFDGTKVLTGSADKTARLWDIESSKLLTTLRGHSGEVMSVTFSLDGTKLLTSSVDRTARLWETESGKLLVIFKGHADTVTGVTFSPDGTKILTSSEDKTARLWETTSGKLLRIYQHELGVMSVAISFDGTKAVTGSTDDIARLWEIESGKLLATLKGHKGTVTSVAFSPDGKQILTGSEDTTTRLWETTSGKLLATLQGHTDEVMGVAFSPDGKQILTGSEDMTARLWKIESGKLLIKMQAHTDDVVSMVFSSDGAQVLTGSRDGTARLWKTQSGKLVKTLSCGDEAVWSVAFSPDDTKALTASQDGSVRLWATESGKLLSTLKGHDPGILKVFFSPDGTKILTAPLYGVMRLWETNSGKLLVTLHNHSDLLRTLSFSPDGTKILAGFWHGTVKLWDMTNGKLLTIMEGHVDDVRSVVFSPDGKQAVSGSDDGTAQLWETISGKLLMTLKGHTGSIRKVIFSLDGSKILTSSVDGTARLWELARGRTLAILRGHSSGVWNVCLSPDGRIIITCDEHGKSFFWRMSGATRVRLLGVHIATYQVEAVHWKDATHVVLADGGGPLNRPHFYRLKLEGKW